MIIFYSKEFDKAFAKFSNKKQDKVINAIGVFQENPFHPILKNHKLKGQKKDFRAFSVGGDIRVIFEEKNGYVEVLMLTVGTHSQVY